MVLDKWHLQLWSNFGITLQLPSAKTIRKYRMYPVDHTMSGAQPPGSSTDPTLPTGSSDYNRDLIRGYLRDRTMELVGQTWILLPINPYRYMGMYTV